MDEAQRTELVGEASKGDPDAIQKLLILYHPALRSAVRERVRDALRHLIDPDDILQETYAHAFRAVKDCVFDGPAAFYCWLEKIALNQLKDHQRALARQKRDVRCVRRDPDCATSSYAGLADRLTAPDSTPSHKVARSEAVAAVLTSLARLSDDQRAVVRLRFLEGLPVAEVAARLGKTEPAIHMLCSRGLKALRPLLVSISRFLSDA